MAENYEVGKGYYLPVTVYIDRGDEGGDFPIGIKYLDGKAEIRDYIQDNPGILLTAEEVAKANGLHTSPCDERYDAQVDLVTARAAIDHLQEENKKLKQEVAERDELLSDAADRIKTLEEAADRSIFFEKIANQQEVIVALVEKIRRLEGGD